MIHGGDIYRHPVQYDFSVSLNPMGIPPGVREAILGAAEEQICRPSYPQYDNSSLKESVSGFLKGQESESGRIPSDAGESERLLVGNGASELLMCLCQTIRPKKALIPVPSFYGYERACDAVGCKIRFYDLRPENGYLPDQDMLLQLTEDIDLVMLANPNNPTGRLTERGYLMELLVKCRQNRIAVLLDESFIWFCHGTPSMTEVAEEFGNLFILGSFTKLFSIPGIRLGYLYGSDTEQISRIGKNLAEWNVSAAAQKVGCACTEEKTWIIRTQEYVKAERDYLWRGLEQVAESHRNAGLKLFESDANYLMLCCRLPLYDELLGRGILIRNLENMRGLPGGFYRIGIRSREENEVLIRTIREVISHDAE